MKKTARDKIAVKYPVRHKPLAVNPKKDNTIHAMEIFFSTFSHEIKGQLAGIVQCYHCMLEGKDTDYYLQSIGAISRNALNILDNMLSTTKVHAGKLDIRAKNETFPFREWIETYIQLFETATSILDIDICFTVHPSLSKIEITSDKVKLGQILNNLLSNALTYSFSKTCIVVECYAKDTDLILQVSNQGSGIPANKIDSLFKPYEQIGKGNAGTGLGLYICQLYAHLLGGQITVQSKVGATTTFTVHIPDCVSPIAE